MRSLRVVAVGCAALFVLSGCSATSAGPGDTSFTDKATGTLNAWGFDNADDVGTSRLDYAKEQLSDVTIKVDATAFDAQKFTTRSASGNVPDVVQMDRNFVATYAAQGLILPLDECYSVHDVDPEQRYYESVVGDITWDDQVWAVPQFYQPPAIMLNTRVMQAAGVDPSAIDTSKPDELLAAVKKMYKESGGVPTLLGLDPVAPSQAGLWLLGMGGNIIGDDGKPTLDSEENAQAVDFLTELLDAQGGYAKVKSFSDSFDTFGDQNQFVADQVAAQVDAQWYVNVLTPYVGKVQIGAVPFKDPDGEPFTVASGTAFVIPAAAKNKDAACAWALELTSSDAWEAAGAARAQTVADTPGAINTGLFTGSPAADESIREQYVKPSGDAGFDQTISTFYDVVGNGKSFGASPAGQEIQSELQNALTSAFLGDKSSSEALKDAQDAAMRAYDRVVK
ncbi:MULTISPECIES: ABC transporter substrate-binding protein [unclassified Leifsonia]|uniref:ABC transporter substrate-binding protein n=1 Tax=unclassified Leifsonia TaxID=2663824 RepID=UPI0006F35382|nr:MULTISPECIES: extracellular solute-binding protein [unclassified Leifsonia]KQX06666.1 sugar ABC transporter substrate-binding protein [Leifsonia sp. Root1293]KRA10950.1 sugar ABC transporter substrate-binding protein [Leifsonia sp. Root60]